MKLLNLAIISFLCAFSDFSLSEQTIVQSIPLHHPTQSIESFLSGDIEVVYANQVHIDIETLLKCPSGDQEALNYARSAGHFKIMTEYCWDTACLQLKEKRINTVIYNHGKVYQPQKRFRITLPKHLSFIE